MCTCSTRSAPNEQRHAPDIGGVEFDEQQRAGVRLCYGRKVAHDGRQPAGAGGFLSEALKYVSSTPEVRH